MTHAEALDLGSLLQALAPFDLAGMPCRVVDSDMLPPGLRFDALGNQPASTILHQRYLPGGETRGPVVVLNTNLIRDHGGDEQTVLAVAVHELAHALAQGWTSVPPARINATAVNAMLARPVPGGRILYTDDSEFAIHSPRWVRGFIHLLDRAEDRGHGWPAWKLDLLEPYFGREIAGEINCALSRESYEAAKSKARIVDVLNIAPPLRFKAAIARWQRGHNHEGVL